MWYSRRRRTPSRKLLANNVQLASKLASRGNSNLQEAGERGEKKRLNNNIGAKICFKILQQGNKSQRNVHSFPGAAITNRHKLGGFKQQKFILFPFGGQESKQGIGGAGSPPNSLGEDSFLPCLFQLPLTPGIPWTVAVSLQALPPWSYCLFLFCVKISSSLSMWLHLESTWISQDRRLLSIPLT